MAMAPGFLTMSNTLPASVAMETNDLIVSVLPTMTLCVANFKNKYLIIVFTIVRLDILFGLVATSLGAT